MSWLTLERVDTPEEIDDPRTPLADLAASMADVARTNRWFGGIDAIVSHVDSLAQGMSSDRPVRILDVATGTADIPRALVEWGRRQGRSVSVVAVDNQSSMLELARSQCHGYEDEIRFVQADADALPFPHGCFDIAVCALAFHHFGIAASSRVLASMDNLTTRGVIVSDLKRDRLALGLVQFGLAALGAHRITRHDGPASVRRAFTLRDFERIVALSGIAPVEKHTHWYFRTVLVRRKA